MGYLDIPRSQIDRLTELGRVEGGERLIAYRHTDAGWTAYRPLQPHHMSQIWYMSQSDADRARIEQFPQVKTSWLDVKPGRGKGDDIHFGPWYCFLDGRNPNYPDRILEAQYAEVLRRIEKMRHDDGDPQAWDVYHWQDINPVHTEGLIQLTCGSPQIIYHVRAAGVEATASELAESQPWRRGSEGVDGRVVLGDSGQKVCLTRRTSAWNRLRFCPNTGIHFLGKALVAHGVRSIWAPTARSFSSML